VENHVCLSRVVQMMGETWRAATTIMAVVGDLVHRTKDGQAQVRYSVAGRLRDRVMWCAVCTVHKETRSAGFLV
jgi:predicted DCC family thiol-disulfide oxidoreductase YuxK